VLLPSKLQASLPVLPPSKLQASLLEPPPEQPHSKQPVPPLRWNPPRPSSIASSWS
jgi:hypothetical protein